MCFPTQRNFGESQIPYLVVGIDYRNNAGRPTPPKALYDGSSEKKG